MIMQTHRHRQTQSSSGTVEQPNGCRHKGAPEALRLAPGEHQPVAEGAPHLPQLSMEGMGGVAHDGLEFVPHPPLPLSPDYPVLVPQQSWPSSPLTAC